jgi:gliding motility-associated lipoprotein GldD
MTKLHVLLLLFSCILPSCKKNYTPKPRGFLRIELPAAQYVAFVPEELPCGFNISTLTTVETPSKDRSSNWLNINYDNLHAKIYCSYQSVTPRTFHKCADDCRRLMERSVKNADAITEHVYENVDRRIYGVLFLIEGECASPVQFMLTDSASNFFRGALYHKYSANADSLAPVTEYIKEDVIELIQSFYWKE